MELELYNESDLGQRQRTESREPYFADATYVKADVPSPIVVQADGQCRLSDVKYSKYPQQKSCSTGKETKEVLYWECSSCCKPVSVQDIVDTKLLFEGNIPEMRKSLDELDQCPHTHTYKQEWHYPISRTQVCNPTGNTKPVAEGGSSDESHCTDEDLSDEDTDDEGCDGEGDDCPVLRAGHPIVCHLEGSPCQSKLRILRVTAVHYPKVAQFQRSVYEAVKANKTIRDIDEAIHSKQYDCLMKACNLDFQALLKQNTESEPYSEMRVGDVLSTPFRIKNLEAKLLTRNATAIKEYDKKVHDYHTHACLCCEQMFKRSQVAEVDLTTFKENPVWLQICAYALLTNPGIQSSSVITVGLK